MQCFPTRAGQEAALLAHCGDMYALISTACGNAAMLCYLFIIIGNMKSICAVIYLNKMAGDRKGHAIFGDGGFP